MQLVLIILMAVYLTLIVISGINTNRVYRGVFIAESERVSVYWQTIIESWAAALILGACALLAGFGIDTDLGFGLHFFQFQTSLVFTIIVLLISGGFFLITLMQFISLATNNAARIQAWRQISDGASRNVVLKNVGENLLIPRSTREKNLFSLVSLTAAICEEFTLRGVLFIVIGMLLPGLSPYLVPLLAGALFGIAHCYQGLSGVLKTGLMGIGFGYLYLACGSLIPGIILHFLIDITNRYLFPDGFPHLLNGQTVHRPRMIRPR